MKFTMYFNYHSYHIHIYSLLIDYTKMVSKLKNRDLILLILKHILEKEDF